jgi:hypothetical protein
MQTHGAKLMDKALTIAEFCSANRISQGLFFKLKRRGEAPAEFRVGRRVLITTEAADKWRQEREITRATPPQGEAA